MLHDINVLFLGVWYTILDIVARLSVVTNVSSIYVCAVCSYI